MKYILFHYPKQIMNKKAILEGLLFVVGEDGLTLDQIEEVLDISNDEAKELVSELKKKYEEEKKIWNSIVWRKLFLINPRRKEISLMVSFKNKQIIVLLKCRNLTEKMRLRKADD